MVALLAAVAVFLFGLLLMGVAFLSAHRTVMPMISRPGLLWWPGVALLILSVVILNLPSYLAFTACERGCDIVGGKGGAPTEAYAVEVQQDFDSCVANGVAEVHRKATEARRSGEDADVDGAVRAAEPGIRELCEVMAVERCITTCYGAEQSH